MEVIVKCVAGSHLFGLNTPKSDKDYKGVYLPTAEDIILNRVKGSINNSTNKSNTKNTEDDVDIEFYSLDKFYKMLQQGQTVALELLFTPEEFIIEKSSLWDEIVSNRGKLVHNGVRSFVGYAQKQASKYGIRGSRMGELEGAITMLKDYQTNIIDKHKSTIQDSWDEILLFSDNNKYSSIVELPVSKNMTNSVRDHWKIIDKKFDGYTKINYVIERLEEQFNEYGDRSRKAKENKGIDWKAISHCLRVCHQGKELFRTGKITLPIVGPERNFILNVKKGKYDFTSVVQPVIEEWIEDLNNEQKKSQLNDNIKVNHYILDFYKRRILNNE